MKRSRIAVAAAALAVSCLTGCHLPGKPGPDPEVPRPDEVMSFDRLYGENCAGCHGAQGHHGAATDLANPEYLAIVDDGTLRDVITNGERGTMMPAFGPSHGGGLTDAQINGVIAGMRSRWSKPDALAGVTPPPYRSTHPGDAAKGQAVYQAACAQCHGVSADQPSAGGSILDGSFLALINEQTIRTTILAGRPDIGQPDWKNLVPGRALTDAELTDVSKWLIAQRPARPGYPYPNAHPTSERPGEVQPLSEKKN